MERLTWYFAHYIATISQIHLIPAQSQRAQSLAPYLFDMLDSFQQVGNKLLRILGRGEVTQVGHGLVLRAGNFIRRGLRHLWGVGPIVFACEHIDWACIRINRRDTGPAVPSAKVEV